MRAVDKVTAGEFECGLVDGVFFVDVLQRRFESKDVFDQPGDVLRDAVVAGSQRCLDASQHVVWQKVGVVASRRSDGCGRLPFGVDEAVVGLGDVVERLYCRFQPSRQLVVCHVV